MRRAALVLALSVPLALLGCGDGEDDTTTEDTSIETATEATATEPAAASGPQGELSERGIGSAELGASTEEVEAAFGPPDRERELPGCELAGPNATPIVQWSWDLESGGASIDFVAADRTLISYRTTSPDLPTAAGVRVGDSFQALRDSYGAVLKRLDLGARSNERAGLWYVGKPAKAWLLFTLAGGAVKTIQGGDIQICE